MWHMLYTTHSLDVLRNYARFLCNLRCAVSFRLHCSYCASSSHYRTMKTNEGHCSLELLCSYGSYSWISINLYAVTVEMNFKTQYIGKWFLIILWYVYRSIAPECITSTCHSIITIDQTSIAERQRKVCSVWMCAHTASQRFRMRFNCYFQHLFSVKFHLKH